MVDPGHHRRIRSKIAGQTLHIELDGAEPVLRQVEKGSHFRLTETINRLHRIADAEDTAPIVSLPARRELLHQIELRRRGVLEFVEQEMLQPVIESQAEVGGRVRSSERAQRRHRDGREIHRPFLPKDAVQFGRRKHQYLGHIAHSLPVRIVIARFRKIANSAEGSDDIPCGVSQLELLEQRLNESLLRAAGREAELLVDPLANLVAAREKHGR
jgi:hypothetical protein